MSAKYLIRLDDACPTMSRARWDEIEDILDTYDIRPLVAVVPNNCDKDLEVDPEDVSFWDRVLRWQKKEWIIGMHGYRHILRPTDAAQCVPLHARSEFAGLSVDIQGELLASAGQIFADHGITPRVWIAPAHSFDLNTLRALKAHSRIEVISDGIAMNPYLRHGYLWVPQQLWRFRYMPVGLWTVCLHPNEMDKRSMRSFAADIRRYHDRIVDLSSIGRVQARRTAVDLAFSVAYWLYRRRLITGALAVSTGLCCCLGRQALFAVSLCSG